MSELKNKPEDTNFKQQRLKAFRPIYTPISAAAVFFTVSIFFFAFGFPLYIEANKIKEVSQQYDNICTSSSCTISVNIPETIPGPVYFYYEMTNFFQNHRLFVRSKSYSQLRNGNQIALELTYCDPARYNSDFVGYYNSTEKNLVSTDVARPCGLVARSVFNDTYSIDSYPLNENNIVFSNDHDMWVDADPKKE